jgi:hypothetical protein
MYPAIKQALDALRATLAEASGFDLGTSQRRFRISIPHPMGRFTRWLCAPPYYSAQIFLLDAEFTKIHASRRGTPAAIHAASG